MATPLIPFSVVCSLFFLWAIGVHLNDILIPHFKSVFHLNDFRSALIQAAFFGGYFVAAFPAGRFMERFGYKRGIVAGLLTCAAGALMFIPAAYIHVYSLFLASLFVMACGQSFLEVSANPYIALLGSPDKAAFRLNVAQAINAAGAVLTPILGAALILKPAETSAALGHPASESRLLIVPYLGLVTAYLGYALVVACTRLPEIQEQEAPARKPSAMEDVSQLLGFPRLIWGVVAQLFYVGAQVGVASFVIRLAEHQLPSLQDSVAAVFLRYHLLGFMLGRIAGAVILKSISPAKVLALFGGAATAACLLVMFGTGVRPVWAAVALGACNSIMFPTIFALSLDGLGRRAKIGASFLVMAIIGGAVLPVAMGLLSDAFNIQIAFAVPLVSYVVVSSFALFTCQPIQTAEPGVVGSASKS
jgi:FHS family L-fucose permease-like MFS transporter